MNEPGSSARNQPSDGAAAHSLISLLKADLLRLSPSAGVFRFFYLFLLHPGFKAVVYYRLAHWFYLKRIKLLPAILKVMSVSRTGAELYSECRIGPGLLIYHPVGVVIGRGAVIGAGATIHQNSTIGEANAHSGGAAYPTIGNHAFICAGAVLIGPIVVGDDAIVGANSVVRDDVPEKTTVAGAPARIVRDRRTS